MQEDEKKFGQLNAELIFIFREEAEGPAGLKKIRERTGTKFTLAVDLNKKSTSPYSPGRRVFDNYVIDREGIVRGIIPGTLSKRATTEQLLKYLRECEE